MENWTDYLIWAVLVAAAAAAMAALAITLKL
jgi:hypothetical protein